MSAPDADSPGSPAIASAGGRHHVTVLFSDLCASSRLATGVAPEVNDQILETVISTAVEVIARHGGVVNQCHGDGVLAVFGFPRIQEDDVRRAVEAGLEVHSAVSRLDFSDLDLPRWFAPRMHSGIDSGLVIIGDGDWIQGQYKVTGPAANTASALAGEAGIDEIVSGASTLRGVLPFFSTSDYQPIAIKGLERHMPVRRVLGRSTVNTRFAARAHRGLTAFFGREAELATLQHALEEASGARRLQSVTLQGAPGVGKSRLVEEFLRRNQRDCEVCRGYCDSYGDTAPLQPFRQILLRLMELELTAARDRIEDAVDKLAAELGADFACHRQALVTVLASPPELLARQAGQALVDALTALFTRLAGRSPLVLIVDDWQWVDQASRHVLGSTVAALEDLPALVVLASRTVEELDLIARRSSVVRLGPFSRMESTRAIRALLPGFPDADVDWIYQQSGGNALFIEELCELTPGSSLDRRYRPGSPIPKWLRGLIGSRLERLPTTEADLVRAAAVVGNVIPAWLLEAITGYTEQDEVFRRLAQADILSAGDVPGLFRFKHGLTRDALYELVSHTDKRKLHGRIAHCIEAQYPPGRRAQHWEMLAYHYAGAGDHQRAYAYARRAGGKALAASSLDRARNQFSSALDALGNLDDSDKMRRRWIDMALSWALPCVYGPVPGQLPVLQRAIAYASALGDTNRLAQAHYWLGYLYYVIGDQGESIQHCRRGLALAQQSGDFKLLAQVQATLGQSLAAAGQHSDAFDYLDMAIAAKGKRKQSKSLPVGSIYATICKSVALADLGDFGAAHECARWALELAGGSGHEIESSVLDMYGAVLLWQGRWQDAREAARRAQDIAGRVYAPYLLAIGRALEHYASWRIDGDAGHIEPLRRACEWLDERQQRLFVSFAYGWLADSLADAGSLQEAHYFGQRALAQARRQDHVGEGMALRALARVAALAPELDELTEWDYFERAMQAALSSGSAREAAVTRLHRAKRCMEAGRREEAGRLSAEARRAFARMGMDWFERRAAALATQLS